MVSLTLDNDLQVIISTRPCLKNFIIILVLLLPTTNPLSFDFTSFNPNEPDMNYEQSAYSTENVILLTRDSSSKFSIGRATYAQPLHLWDNASGNISDFATNFTFVVNTPSEAFYGDGFAFFLAPNGSKIPDRATGGTLGLTPWDPLNSIPDPFVAIEFDLYSNTEWDPTYSSPEHVGIDINSMRSVTTVAWSVGDNGTKHQAWISYVSKSRNLTVVFTGFGNGVQINHSLSYIINLSEHLPEFVTFGFSAATTGHDGSRFTINTWNFNSNLDRNINPTGTASNPVDVPGSPTGTPNNMTDQPVTSNTGLVIGFSVGGPAAVLALGLFLCIFWKQIKGTMNGVYETSITDELEYGSGPKKFTYSELKQATNNFAVEDKLGEGGFGSVYKGFFGRTNLFVAVKRVSSGSMQGIKEYASEVKVISRLRHRNLVQLCGWCHEKRWFHKKRELLLVYEFMPNGSLDTHLFQGNSLLDWGIRYKIAQGLASALLYLHQEWEQCVLHRDIKTSNVMLDADFNAKLGDFGLARLVDHGKGSQTTILAGTIGYIAPECMVDVVICNASKETDVFSFGVVALEIASGRRPIDTRAQTDQVNLVKWVWSLYGTGQLLDAADPLLGTNYDAQEMEVLMTVGLWCAHPDFDSRPTIRQAVLVLKLEAQLPVLPSRMPMPRCVTSSHYGTSVSRTSQTSSSSYVTQGSSEYTTATLGVSSVVLPYSR